MGLWAHGKSVELLKVAHNYEQRGYNVLLITSSLDDRFGTDKITTRIGISKEAIAVTCNENLKELIKEKVYDNTVACVLVDEAQFLTKTQVDELGDIVDYFDIPVICYGLKTDFLTNLFEGSKRLFEIADDIEEIKTVCECLKKATTNARFVDGNIATSGEQVVIGDSEYKSLCRKCYKNKIKEQNMFKIETKDIDIDKVISENFSLSGKQINSDEPLNDNFSSIFLSSFDIDNVKVLKDVKHDEIIDKYINESFEDYEEETVEEVSQEKEVVEYLNEIQDMEENLEEEVVKIYKEGIYHI